MMMKKNKPVDQREKRSADCYSVQKRKYIIMALTVIVLLICGFYLRFSWNRYQDAASSEAIILAKSVETLLHNEHIAQLTGGPEDLENPEYHITKRSLIRLAEITNPIQFAYLLGTRDGNIIFMIDSETIDSPDYSPPGQVYYEATDSDWKPFLTGETVLTEPLTDRWGTWISALVPIEDPISGEIIAVLGLDFSASAWRANLWNQMIPNVVIVFIILILFFTLQYIWLQQSRIRNLSEKLALDEALYHSVFEQAPIGIAIVNDKSFVIQSKLQNIGMNSMFMQILNRTREELDSINWTEITHPDDLQADLAQFDQFQNGEISGYSMEKRFIRPDGSSVWTNMKVSPLIGLPYSHTMHLCLIEDISIRKEAEDMFTESERSKSVLVSNLPGLAYRRKFDREWTMLFVSDGCFNLTGYPPESILYNREKSFNDLIAPQYRDILWNEWARILPKRLPFKYEYEIITACGEQKWVLEMGEGVYNKQGEVEALEGIILDISDRKKTEEQLKHMLKRTQSMINNHEAVMLLIEPVSGEIIEANNAATVFYGYSKEELLHMTIQEINTLDKDEVRALSMKALGKGEKYFKFTHILKSGAIKVVDVYSSPIDYDGQRVLFSIIFDVTEREEIAKQNEFLAYHDYLTGLYNRRFFEEEFHRRVKLGEFPIALFLGDVDGFKVYNDTFGHAEGDRVLKELANRVKRVIGDQDVFARVGGDEFSILVSGMDKNEIRRYLDKLNQEIDTAFEDSPTDELPAISWGYGFQREREDTLDVLQEEAEAFMYNRKFYSYKSSKSKTVDVIMATLFTKSEREKRHSERVGILSETIAKKLHLSNAEIDKIRVAGMLHDIGKIGIDEAILNKAGELNAVDWEIIKLHPAKGAGILEKTHEYHEISNIVLSHHERFDGLGYPRRLKAEDIPLGARIIAVADTYDAITNERPYKKAIDKRAAIEELKKCSGTQLDPEIVSVFIREVIEKK